MTIGAMSGNWRIKADQFRPVGWITIWNRIICSILLLSAIACGQGWKYKKVVERELNSGIRNDTVFLGVYFGMTYEQFYDHISELGHQGKVSQGDDMSVQCEIDVFDSEIRMNFFPEYQQDSIQSVHVSFEYVNWAPWNKQTSDDHLWEDVLHLYKTKYGTDYIELKSKRSVRPAIVWVHGNQRITLFQKEEAKVNVIFNNLLRPGI